MEALLIVKSSGIMFIGVPEIEPEQDLSSGVTLVRSIAITLKNPRMIFANPEERQLSLAKCIGNPEVVTITGIIDFQYQNNDADLATFYQYEIEGYPEELVKNDGVKKEPSKIITLHP